MNVHIITIGTELLIGDTVNTNASWLGRMLTTSGFQCDQILTIDDRPADIRSAIEHGLAKASVTIVTGGLGPTKDDVTKSVLYEKFNAKPVLHQPTLDHIKSVLSQRNIPVSESNIEQAYVPDQCEVLFNKRGTAPGMWFEKEGRYLAVLPGVPAEMKHLTENEILPRLERLFPDHPRYFSRYYKIAGIGESTLGDEVIPEIDQFTNGTNLNVASLPGGGVITLRLSVYARDEKQADEKITPAGDYIENQAEEHIFSMRQDGSLAATVGELLSVNDQTLGVAESCTGGYLSNLITEVPGCSAWYKGGVNCYSNDSKVGLLGVDEATLNHYGAVSKETALELAKGAALKLNADVGVSTTGVAGPSGGTPDKPVGTVWVGYYDAHRHFALKLMLFKDRKVNKQRASVITLDVIRRVLSGISTMPYGLQPEYAEAAR